MSNDDTEGWEICNESLITLDLSSEITPDAVKAATLSENGVSLIGLDSPTPFLRIGNQVFEGNIDTLVGTSIYFGVTEKETAPKVVVPRYGLSNAIHNVDNVRSDLSLLGTGNVVIGFHRVKVEEA